MFKLSSMYIPKLWVWKVKKKGKNIFAKNPSKFGGLGNRILRFVVGIISLLAVYLLLNYLEDTLAVKLEEVTNIFKYLKYTIVVFWGVAGAPAIFKLFKLA